MTSRAVDAQFAGQRADLVGEGNLHGVERIAGVLDQLRGAQGDHGRLHREAHRSRLPVRRPRGHPANHKQGGLHEVATAAPSRRNSGLETILVATRATPIWGITTSSQVPGNTVLRTATYRGRSRPPESRGFPANAPQLLEPKIPVTL